MRLIAKYIAQLLTVILSGTYTLTDLFHLQVGNSSFRLFGLTINGEKTHVELGIRLGISICAIVLIALTDVLDVAMPRRAMRDVRDNYIKIHGADWKTLLQPGEIRISMWYAKRHWYWPFWKIFEPVWSDGFAPPHDRALAVRLASWQGISGQAFRSGEVAQLPAISPNPTFGEEFLMLNTFRMTAWQLKKTKDITGMLSIPMVLDRGKAKPTKAVGVINLDSVTDKGDQALRTNKTDLETRFGQYGKVLAFMGG